MLLSELSNKGRHGRVVQESTVGQDHHALLAPREHDVRPPLVGHKPWRRRPHNGNYDVVFLVSLERVDVEYGVFPNETSGFERVLDRVSLGVIWGDNLEFSPLLHVPVGYIDRSLDFAFVLSDGLIFSTGGGAQVGGEALRTVQLKPVLTSFPSLTSTKRQQAGDWIVC